MNQAVEVAKDGTLILKQPVDLPEILDILIVGGGPGGTAAAFRAKELGLSTLVIDFDDLMRRIRDYSKDKLILPSFGGGDEIEFPKGGTLISLLHFSPIDKDEMCLIWKHFYRENNIPAKMGIELTGFDRAPEGIWQVTTWNHNLEKEEEYFTRHIILAIGRGVPRRFDIPGNTDGISYKLTDPEAYVGSPACVIGGGTSAAEAVIAISNAKIKKDDASPIYWSYRGDKMPRVSRALAGDFFEAYIGNGNIRYYPRSEPAAIVTAEDREEYLAIRTGRQFNQSGPNESYYLEFPKKCCLACIGEDIPESFLESLGIHMMTDSKKKKRMIVTSELETQQPNVYLVGDILSQAYYETEDFDAYPTSFREMKHRGNIKSALRDGVYVAEVIEQKLRGKADVFVNLKSTQESICQDSARNEAGKPLEYSSSEVKEAEIIPQNGKTAVLMRIQSGEVEENKYPVKKNCITTIGRSACDINFPDSLLSDCHASISHANDGYFLRDEDSDTGVFLRVPHSRYLELVPGDVVRAGRQFLYFFAIGAEIFFIHYDHDGNEVGRYPLSEKSVVFGREADVVLQGHDASLSRRHIAVCTKNDKILIKDLKSANGTYLKVKKQVKLENGDQFKVGQQLLCFSQDPDPAPTLSTGPGARSVDSVEQNIQDQREVIKTQQTEGSSKEDELTVTFLNVGKSCGFKKGQTICDIAEENGVEMIAECHSGVCGSDPIRVYSGLENLNEKSDEEKETLEEICELDPRMHRMACMARPKGPVSIEILTNQKI